MSDLFARVRPLVGEVLEARRVAVFGSPRAANLVKYLVACGVRRWVVTPGNAWIDALLEKVSKRYGGQIGLEVKKVASVQEVPAVDLALVVDDVEGAGALSLALPRMAIFASKQTGQNCASFALPGERLPSLHCIGGAISEEWEWLMAAPLMALAARALLLRETAFAMGTWEDAWAKGQRTIAVGGADPTVAGWQAHTGDVAAQTPYRTPSLQRGTLMVVGLGSLGSVAAAQLAPFVERLVLVDPDCVEVENLVRQAYSFGQVGQAKAEALAETLAARFSHLECVPVVASLQDDDEGRDLIDRFGVTAGLVTTGTFSDFAIARALRAAALPHVVGRCYARARFWEGVVVDGACGASYEQVRRGVAVGPTPAPTPEELAAYGAVGELHAEPATAMETGWAAMWLARLTAQMMAAASLREGWLLARLAAGASCFVGGVVVEQSAGTMGDRIANGAAYGVGVTGEVHAWSIAEIA